MSRMNGKKKHTHTHTRVFTQFCPLSFFFHPLSTFPASLNFMKPIRKMVGYIPNSRQGIQVLDTMNRYRVDRVLGEGMFGKAILCTTKADNKVRKRGDGLVSY